MLNFLSLLSYAIIFYVGIKIIKITVTSAWFSLLKTCEFTINRWTYIIFKIRTSCRQHSDTPTQFSARRRRCKHIASILILLSHWLSRLGADCPCDVTIPDQGKRETTWYNGNLLIVYIAFYLGLGAWVLNVFVIFRRFLFLLRWPHRNEWRSGECRKYSNSGQKLFV